MQTNHVTVAQPAMEGTIYPGAKYHPPKSAGMVGRVINMIEIQMSSFTPDAWACLWDLIDLESNSGGWGIGMWYFGYCHTRVRTKMATIDIMQTRHRGDWSLHSTTNQFRWEALLNQENVWARKGIPLVNFRADPSVHDSPELGYLYDSAKHRQDRGSG